MAARSLMDGIPEPGAPGPAAPGHPGYRKLLLGAVAVVLLGAAGAVYIYQSRGGALKQPATVNTAEARLRAELEAKNPPPAPPTEPVVQGSGHRVQKP